MWRQYAGQRNWNYTFDDTSVVCMQDFASFFSLVAALGGWYGTIYVCTMYIVQVVQATQIVSL